MEPEEPIKKSPETSSNDDNLVQEPKKGKKSTLEPAEIVEQKVEKQRKGVQEIEPEINEKAKREYDDEVDEKTEELLRRAQKQRSLVDDVSQKPSQPEGKQHKTHFELIHL